MPVLNVNSGLSFAYFESAFASATGSPSVYAIEVTPARFFSASSTLVPFAARSASLFFTTDTLRRSLAAPCAARSPSRRSACCRCNDQAGNALQIAAELVDLFLFSGFCDWHAINPFSNSVLTRAMRNPHRPSTLGNYAFEAASTADVSSEMPGPIEELR